MKIKLWTALVAVGVVLTACGHDDNNASTTTQTGSSGGGPTGSSAPNSSDFLAFVNAQTLVQPAFGSSAPTATTTLTTDLAIDTPNAFSFVFTSGDALPATTYQAPAACTKAGTTACNPAISADLNSNLN